MQRLETFGDRLRGFARPWELAELRARNALEDFGIFRTAASAVIHGRSPYVATPTAAAVAHFDKFVYPPVAALVFAPFTALPAGPYGGAGCFERGCGHLRRLPRLRVANMKM